MSELSKSFHLGDILSVTTGHMLSPRTMTGVYDIIEHMTRRRTLEIQLRQDFALCVPHLLSQMPWLKEVDTATVIGGDWEKWLAEQVSTYGEQHVVYAIHPEDPDVSQPIHDIELEAIRSMKVITLKLPSQDDSS